MAVVDFAHSEISSNYLFVKFVASVRRAVEEKGLVWDILLDDRGQPIQGHDWDLRVLNGSPDRSACGTAGFKIDNEIRQLALAADWTEVRLPTGQVLPTVAQDFIKAIIGSLCLSGRTGDCAQVVAKAARRIFSSTMVSPDEISREHFEALLSLKPWSEKAERDIIAVAKIIDENLISKYCPVRPNLNKKRQPELLADYRARKDASKLPEK